MKKRSEPNDPKSVKVNKNGTNYISIRNKLSDNSHNAQKTEKEKCSLKFTMACFGGQLWPDVPPIYLPQQWRLGSVDAHGLNWVDNVAFGIGDCDVCSVLPKRIYDAGRGVAKALSAYTHWLAICPKQQLGFFGFYPFFISIMNGSKRRKASGLQDMTKIRGIVLIQTSQRQFEWERDSVITKI